jgi:NAD(P)-dependent dehydrogenase (short-subunit alcohol dehydrogenase family)
VPVIDGRGQRRSTGPPILPGCRRDRRQRRDRARVADSDQVEAAAEQVESEAGPIDVWVNVAFTSVFAEFDRITPDEFKRVTEVSYLGYVYGTMAALRRMKARDRGTVVQVGSALAYRGTDIGSTHDPRVFAYSLLISGRENDNKYAKTLGCLPVRR